MGNTPVSASYWNTSYMYFLHYNEEKNKMYEVSFFVIVSLLVGLYGLWSCSKVDIEMLWVIVDYVIIIRQSDAREFFLQQ